MPSTDRHDNTTETELRKKIAQLEDALRQAKSSKKYGLVWEDHPEEFEQAAHNAVPVLKSKGGKFKDLTFAPTADHNILIEGDNYHALSVLQYTHRGKIDVIYIDPPYNTGAEDWRYNNDYVDRDDPWRHSKWISFMDKRLALASSLLSDTGIIACAIDHYEVLPLGLLMDQVFGEKNRLGIVTVIHKPEGRQFAKFFSPSSEFMLMYAKDKSKAAFNSISITAEQAAKFTEHDSRGPYYLKNYIRLADGKYSTREADPDGWYPIYVSKNLQSFSLTPLPDYDPAWPTTSKGQDRTWKTFGDTFMAKVESGDIIASKTDGRLEIYEKIREQEVVKTHWARPEYHGFHHGTKLIERILGSSKLFNFPKSLPLVSDVLKLTTNKSSIVVDFFGGSGTTGHAVLELNKQDGGDRRFILVTNNENKIAEEVTYERLKRVMTGYTTPKGEKVDGLGGNLVYLKTDFVKKDLDKGLTDEAKLELSRRANLLLSLRENTFTPVEATDHYEITSSPSKITAVYFREDKSELPALLDKLLDIADGKPVTVYIFAWEKGAYKAGIPGYPFNFQDIPEPIIEVYQSIGY